MASPKQTLVHIPVTLVKRAAAQWPRLREVPAIAALAPRESGAAAVRFALLKGLEQLEDSAPGAPAPAAEAAPLQQEEQRSRCTNCGAEAAPGTAICDMCRAIRTRLEAAQNARDKEVGLELASLLASVPDSELGVTPRWGQIRHALARWRKAKLEADDMLQMLAERQAKGRG